MHIEKYQRNSSFSCISKLKWEMQVNNSVFYSWTNMAIGDIEKIQYILWLHQHGQARGDIEKMQQILWLNQHCLARGDIEEIMYILQ